MFYAVNICDLTTVQARGDFALNMLLALVVNQQSRQVEAEGGLWDGIAVVMDGEGGEEQHAAIAELIRKKYKRFQLRIYTSKTGQGSWRRI